MKNIDLIKQETRNVVLTVLPNINSEDLLESKPFYQILIVKIY